MNLRKGVEMKIQEGDWVQTKSGEVGQVITCSKLSAFVRINADGEPYLAGYLLSELTKIDPPQGSGDESLSAT